MTLWFMRNECDAHYFLLFGKHGDPLLSPWKGACSPLKHRHYDTAGFNFVQFVCVCVCDLARLFSQF